MVQDHLKGQSHYSRAYKFPHKSCLLLYKNPVL